MRQQIQENREIHKIDDAQVDAALRRFRESVHGWSEVEFAKARRVRRSRWESGWNAMARLVVNPAMGWALTGVLAFAIAGVPVRIHQERQAASELQAQRQMELQRERRQAEVDAQRQAAAAINDDELLDHVDADIAQAAPDAMQPLASLMSDSGAK